MGSLNRAFFEGIGIVGESKALCDICSLIGLISNHPPAAILIEGETGTGKELIAKAIHQADTVMRGLSPDKRPFVVAPLPTFSSTLFESELFGHRRGAFSGANEHHEGYFSQAHGGTLLLDEVQGLPLDLQQKLLRVVEQREVTPVGSTSAKPIDVRIIVASNRNLLALIAEGKFRADLFYRLNHLKLTLSPLRDRPEDIVPQARHFLAVNQIGRLDKRLVTHIDEAVEHELRRLPWPGNSRELKAVIQSALIKNLTGTTLGREDFREDICPLQVEQRVDWTLRTAVRLHIEKASLHFPSRHDLAAALGISIRTLYAKIKEYAP